MCGERWRSEIDFYPKKNFRWRWVGMPREWGQYQVRGGAEERREREREPATRASNSPGGLVELRVDYNWLMMHMHTRLCIRNPE